MFSIFPAHIQKDGAGCSLLTEKIVEKRIVLGCSPTLLDFIFTEYEQSVCVRSIPEEYEQSVCVRSIPEESEQSVCVRETVFLKSLKNQCM